MIHLPEGLGSIDPGEKYTSKRQDPPSPHLSLPSKEGFLPSFVFPPSGAGWEPRQPQTRGLPCKLPLTFMSKIRLLRLPGGGAARAGGSAATAAAVDGAGAAVQQGGPRQHRHVRVRLPRGDGRAPPGARGVAPGPGQDRHHRQDRRGQGPHLHQGRRGRKRRRPAG